MYSICVMNKNYKFTNSNINNNNIQQKILKSTKSTKSPKLVKSVNTYGTTKQIKINNNKNKSNNNNKIEIENYSDLDLDVNNSVSDIEYHTDFDFGSDFENYSNGEKCEYNEEELNELHKDIDNDIHNQTKNQTQTQTQTQTQQVDITQVFQIFEQLFNNPQTQQQIYEKSLESSAANNIVHIRKNSVIGEYESKIKKQLVEIVEASSKTNRYGKTEEEINEIEQQEEKDENYIKYQRETTMKLDIITTSIENDDGFIRLSEEKLFEELKTIPSQADFDDFCKELEYSKKLTYETSTKREKLFTIMYTIGNYCIEPNIDLKRVILFIIKFEIIRNDLISRIIKMNRKLGRCDVLDCLTSDMLVSGLGYFLTSKNIKIVSKNIAYYFTKIFYM